MKLLKNCIIGFRYQRWTFIQTLLYLLKGAERELFATKFFEQKYADYVYNRYKRIDENGLEYLKIGDIKMSALPTLVDKLSFASLLPDVFFSYLYCGDSYEKNVFLKLDSFLPEGPYGYQDETIDVTVKPNDVVIDAGAWAGDYSAYCAHKNAKVYAFEPCSHEYGLLETTAILNENKIIPVKMGLGSEQTTLCFSTGRGLENFIIEGTATSNENSEMATITTLDKFIEEIGIDKVDFLKADIEGYEREFLKGAKSTIQKLLPKIAICTYHLPDDPEVLESIIKEYNPNYRIVHSRHKLFAQYIPSDT
ncbi:MAG: FkbM family methyltransferase [Bacteroidales bacterium]|nr:FkbM family methyltransferase [Bacteroidales bacterium]